MKVEGSNITINDSVYNKMSIIPKGACEQDSYSGKNKINVSSNLSVSNGFKEYTINVPAGSYILSCEGYITDGTYNSMIDFLGSTSSSTPTYLNVTNKSVNVTFSEDKVLMRIYSQDTYPHSLNITSTFTNLMLRLSSITDDTYEPYTGGIPSPNPDYPQDIRVVTGDNSVVINNGNIFDGIMELGAISGADGSNTSNDNMVRTPDYIDLLNIRKIAIPNSNNSQQTIGLRFYNKDKQYLGSFSYTSLTIINLDTINVGNRTQYYTSNADIYYLRFVVTTSNDTTIKYAVMNNDTTYIAFQGIQTLPLHLGTEYLAGIGDYKDEIVGKTDEWKIKRYVGKVVLDGTQSLTLRNTSSNGTKTYALDNPFSYKLEKSDDGNILSNYYNHLHTVSGVISMYDPNDLLDVLGISLYYLEGSTNRAVYINTKETLPIWFETHNTEIYYILATPVEETITDQTLITDLNNMYQALSYDGTTIITVTSEDTNAQMTAEVEYTSESDMCEKLLFIFNKMKDKLYHIIRSL